MTVLVGDVGLANVRNTRGDKEELRHVNSEQIKSQTIVFLYKDSFDTIHLEVKEKAFKSC